MANTYTQLKDGSWGIRVAGTARENQEDTVAKKSGEIKTETVARVLWTGKDSRSGETISLCAIARSGNGHAHKPGTCMNCGERCNPRYRRCLDCVDGGGGAHGGQSYYDRNG